MADGPIMVALSRAAMAVLEEIRRDQWPEKPIAEAHGLFVVPIEEEVYQRIKNLSLPNESPSALILRAYREGKFSQPLRME